MNTILQIKSLRARPLAGRKSTVPRALLMEISGSLGDLGLFLPLVAATCLATGLDIGMVLVCAGGSLFSSASMLFIAAFAANKVEGFALTKMYGLVGMIPLVAYFVPEPWQFLFGVFPPYWACKAVWTIADGGRAWYLYVALSAVTALIYLWWLMRRFRAAAYG